MENERFLLKYARKFNALRKNDVFTDFRLISEDDRELKIHKIVLIAASEYFEDLFRSGMEETVENFAKFDRISFPTLENIISYLYTGELDDCSAEECLEISAHARYFLLPELEELCVSALKPKIDETNVLQHWRTAKEQGINSMIDFCLEYITKHMENNVENSAFLESLALDELRAIIADGSLKYDQELVFKLAWGWARCNGNDEIQQVAKFREFKGVLDFSSLSKDFIYTEMLSKDSFLENGEICKEIVKALKANWIDKKETFVLVTHKNVMKFTGRGFSLITEGHPQEDFRGMGCTTYKDNSLFISGGYKSGSHIKSSQCSMYIPYTNFWNILPLMIKGRSHHACATISDKIYICGGIKVYSYELSCVEVFEGTTSKWCAGPNMRNCRSSYGLTALNGSLYAFGGAEKTCPVERWDPRTNDWNTLNTSLEGYTQTVALDNSILVFNNGQCLEYDIRADKMTLRSKLDFGWPFLVHKVENEIGIVKWNNMGISEMELYDMNFKRNLVMALMPDDIIFSSRALLSLKLKN